jgi:hypothetical protein
MAVVGIINGIRRKCRAARRREQQRNVWLYETG